MHLKHLALQVLCDADQLKNDAQSSPKSAKFLLFYTKFDQKSSEYFELTSLIWTLHVSFTHARELKRRVECVCGGGHFVIIY